jgi:aminoglycoside phosphotransferase (APT) family kinase protein
MRHLGLPAYRPTYPFVIVETPEPEQPLRGSGRAPVTRVGRTVRRPVGPWTPAVHALLRYLEEVGFDAAPRVLGIDAEGREVLTFVDGEDGHHARKTALHDDHALVAVGQLIRRFHDAVAGFVVPSDAAWQFQPNAPRNGIVCHNDLAPVNTVYVDNRPRAFIDWDFAAPARPEWDLACAAWSFVPLYDDGYCRRHGYSAAPRGPRLRLLCDAYGLTDRAGFIDLIRARELALYDLVRLGAAAGDPHYTTVWRDTAGQRWLDSINYLDRERDEWTRHLE